MKQAPRSRNSPAKRDDERLDLAEVDDEAPASAPKPAPKASINAAEASGCQPSRVEIRHHDADETDHRADRQIDAAGQDDESRADRRDDEEGVVGEDVAEHQRREEIDCRARRRRRTARRTPRSSPSSGRLFLVSSPRPPRKASRERGAHVAPIAAAARRSRPTALTTRLYSGGRPLVRIEVVSAWMTSAPSTAPAEIDAAAGERAAADDDGEDGVELDIEADADGIGRVGVGGQDDARRRRP